MSSVAKITLVIGGARSGKSRYAEGVIATLRPSWQPPCIYVATAEAGDEEMTARIATHRSRRGSDWHTVEAPRALAAALNSCATAPVLVDCLTLWLSNLLLVDADVETEIAGLEKALASIAAPVVLVTNDVGSGVVPDYPLGRRFRDWQGILNQRVAALADRVVLMVAGLPLPVKGAR
jgi:adenosylcobinamide kinase / adenosylcobinamide-phosphate guanylyltransferase